MYIPTQFFGGQNLCVSSSGADVTTHLISGSTLYKVDIFSSPGSHTYQIYTGSANYKVILVGGGGAGGKASGTATRHAGGGGAGGFIYLDNIFFTSGSYPIYVGAGGVEPTTTPNNGETSSLQYLFQPSNIGTYPISGSIFIAHGGGGGACMSGTSGIKGQDGASGGGGAAWGTGGAPTYTVANGLALYNTYDLSPHGFDGAPVDGTVKVGGGGGGAIETASLNSSTPGGGINATFTGFPAEFSAGGYGGNGSTTRISNNTSGSGGSGTFATDTASNRARSLGKNGIVILMHPLCTNELQTCTTYVVNGGVSGGTLTYIECGTGLLVSSSIDFNQQAVICTLPITYGIGTTQTYPSASGTITLTPTGSCTVNIDIPIVPTCNTGSGETKKELYQYTIDAGGTLGPPYNSPAQNWVLYINDQNTIVSQGFGGYGQPTTASFCARPIPAPVIYDHFGSGTGSLTQSSIVCAYYCSSSLAPNCQTWRFTSTYSNSNGLYVNCSGSLVSTPYLSNGSYLDVCINANYTPQLVGNGTWTLISGSC